MEAVVRSMHTAGQLVIENGRATIAVPVPVGVSRPATWSPESVDPWASAAGAATTVSPMPDEALQQMLVAAMGGVVSPDLAAKMVKALGCAVLSALDAPDAASRLLTVDGIHHMTAEKIKQEWDRSTGGDAIDCGGLVCQFQ